MPIIAVPTTAGTASETTINYVITDTAERGKFVFVDPHDIPAVATLTRDLGNPTTLREVGAKQEDLHGLAEAAFADVLLQ